MAAGQDRGAEPVMRWELDRTALTALLAALHPDPTAAAREYERLRSRLVRYFALQGVGRAAEAADEAFNRLARRLAEGESVRKVEPYLAGIARLLVFEERQRMRREQAALGQLASADAPAPEDDRTLRALEQCLRELPDDARELLRRYYSGEGGARIRDREAMAGELGLTANSLRNRVLRLREKLEKTVRERMARDDGRDIPPADDRSTSGGV